MFPHGRETKTWPAAGSLARAALTHYFSLPPHLTIPLGSIVLKKLPSSSRNEATRVLLAPSKTLSKSEEFARVWKATVF